LETKQHLQMSNFKLVLFFILLAIPRAKAQTDNMPVLDQRISINVSNVKVKDVLQALSEQSKVHFTYSSANVPVAQLVSIRIDNQRLGDVLNDLSKRLDIQYSVSKRQIVLARTSQRSVETLAPITNVNIAPHKIDRSISGTIKDDTGEPLVGATVRVKGSDNVGTISDANGNFKLSVPDGSTTLVITSIGFTPQEIEIGNQSVIDITMQPDVQNLNEYVVVGYGQQIRQSVTSSISQVKSKNLTEIASAGLDQALQGRAAGVQVVRNTGAPGGGVSIRIRGTASLLGGQEPLYIIDGIPINNTPTGSLDIFGVGRNGGIAGNEFVNPLSQIPVEDIENIEILKDAASAGIYGARAANGVVLVTTKRGKAGKLDVSLSAYTGYGEVPKERRYKLLSGQEFAAASNLSRRLRNLPIFFADSINVKNTDWQEEIFQKGVMSNVSLNLAGGTDKVRYSFSASYFDQQGTIIGTNFNRVNVKNNFDFQVSKWLKIGSNMMLSYSKGNRLRNTGSGTGTDNFNNNNLYGPSVLSAALVANPTFSAYRDGDLYQIDTLNNNISPVASALEIKLENTDTRFIGNIFLEAQILRGLKFRSNFGSDIRSSYEHYFTPLLPGVFGGAAIGATLENGTYKENLWLTENYLTYDLNLGKHAINLLAGFSAQESKNNGFGIRVRNIPSNQLQTITSGPQQLALREQGFQYWGIVSQFGRATYSFDDKYLVTGTIRRDGSSRFGPENKYGIFPSASAGWLVSKERFLQKSKLISFLKLRASYGLTGNDQVGDVWTWRASIRPLETPTSGYLGASGARPVSIEIGDFSWETTKQTDFGLELGLLQDRIFINVDNYTRVTEDLLYGIALPQTTGFSTVLNNLGSIENKGWEFTINTKNISTKNFKWSTDFNISFNKNKLLSLYEGKTQDSYGDFGKSSLLRVGEPISWQAAKVTGINPANGDFLVQDTNGDGKIDDADMVIIGSPLPKHFGGFNNRFEAYGFDLNVFMTWSYGNIIYNTTRSYLEQVRIPTGAALIANMSRDAYLGRWTADNPNAQYRGFDPSGSLNAVGARPNSFYMEDGSYLRFKAVSIGYNFPKSVLNKLKISNLRIYANANNLYTFTKYKGFDPEVNHNNVGNNIQVGYDIGTYPNSRNYTFGVNANF
jgi:TonB-dependent starch-binding outer membrane protein SusC